MFRRYMFSLFILIIFCISTVCYAEIRVLYLKGTINRDLKIHMILRIGEYRIDGEYYYDKYQNKNPLLLTGNINNKSITLTEYSVSEGETGVFKGEFITPTIINGFWRSGTLKKNYKEYSFSLETYEEYIGHQPLTGFENSQGKLIKFMAPYVQEFCRKESIDTKPLITNLLGPIEDLQESETLAYIGSGDHSDHGQWTYFLSNTPLIYQIDFLNNSNFIVLYNQNSPSDFIGDDNWQIAIVDRDFKHITKKDFHIRLNSNIGNYWDYIKTAIRVSKSGKKTLAIVTYAMSGNKAVPFEQEFTVEFNIEKNIITNVSVKQTKGF